MLAEHSQSLTEEQKQGILCQNVADLYKIDLSALR